jgi:hypothetical protein
MVTSFKIWIEKKDYKDARKSLLELIQPKLGEKGISSKDFNSKQLKEFDDEIIKMIEETIKSNFMYDKLDDERKRNIDICITSKNCTLSNLARNLES